MRSNVRHRTLSSAVGALALAGTLAACGGGSSDGVNGSPPTDASPALFCKTFTDLGAGTTPKQAAVELSKVGTPSGISSTDRHGFEVLLAHLPQLPDNANDRTLTAMAQSLKADDQADLFSFLKYYANECQGG
jgi:hypothetical protein